MEWEIKVQRLWGRVDYSKYIDIIRKRIELLNQLYLIYPYIELQAECLDGRRTKLFGFDTMDPRMWAPAVHYRILPNELVFEFDGGGKEDVKKAVSALIFLGAKPLVGNSGRRGYHIHVLFGPPNGDVSSFIEVPEVVNFRNTLFDILIDIMKTYDVDVSQIDENMKNIHTIRSFYSINPKGRKWKTPVFGDGYEVWRLPRNLYARVLEEMKSKVDADELIALHSDERRKRKGSNRIAWIEKVLAHPEKVHDGRRRLLMYAIIPYLLNVKKLPSQKVAEVCNDWVAKTPRGDDNGLKYLIKSEIKSYSRSGVFPMRYEKFRTVFQEIEEVIS